jgi:hypothetical protein
MALWERVFVMAGKQATNMSGNVGLFIGCGPFYGECEVIAVAM